MSSSDSQMLTRFLIAMFIFLTAKFFQSLVSSECSRLVEAATEKLSVKVEEQNSEIRKLKAMIGEQLSLDCQARVSKNDIFSETWDKDSDPGDEKQGAGEDAGEQGDPPQQQRTQRPGPWRGLRGRRTVLIKTSKHLAGTKLYSWSAVQHPDWNR